MEKLNSRILLFGGGNCQNNNIEETTDNYSRSVQGYGCIKTKDVQRLNKMFSLIFQRFSHLPKRWKRENGNCEVPDTDNGMSAGPMHCGLENHRPPRLYSKLRRRLRQNARNVSENAIFSKGYE